jgi:hypothetical protein
VVLPTPHLPDDTIDTLLSCSFISIFHDPLPILDKLLDIIMTLFFIFKANNNVNKPLIKEKRIGQRKNPRNCT